jgi:hypothetical protein
MEQERRAQRNRAAAIRKGDHGPYTALRWVSTLFKSAAVFLSVAVLAEFIAGVRAEGWGIMPILLGEVARATILVVVLWAGGDLIRLFLQMARDLRAERVLLARIAYRAATERSESVVPELAEGILEGAVDPDPRGGRVAPEGTGPGWGMELAADPGGEGGGTGEAAA